MIPKIIHYCWFGNTNIPDVEKKCIESWRRILPNYKIIIWNEQNFDINVCKYVKQAYEHKKFAFVSDYVRIYALYNYGGIYLDTDVEVISSFDKFLEYKNFLGFENKTFIGTAMIAASKGSVFAKEMLNYYNKISYIDDKGNENLTTNVTLLDNILLKKGLIKNNTRQTIEDIEIFPRDVFFPKKISEDDFQITENTVMIHKMQGSWLTERQKKRGSNKFWINICRPVLRFFNKCIYVIVGDEKAKRIEIKIRNLLK